MTQLFKHVWHVAVASKYRLVHLGPDINNCHASIILIAIRNFMAKNHGVQFALVLITLLPNYLS